MTIKYKTVKTSCGGTYRTPTEIGRENGIPYILRRARYKDITAIDRRECRWFLWVDENEYIGDFRTKNEAMSALRALEK